MGSNPTPCTNPCSSVAEQLPSQANDGGPIPSMDALVDAKTTAKACLSEWLRRATQVRLEQSAQVRILRHAKSAMRIAFSAIV